MSFDLSFSRLPAPGSRSLRSHIPEEGMSVLDELTRSHCMIIVSRCGLRTDIAPGPGANVAAFVEEARQCGVTLDLPFELELDEAAAARLEDELHDAMEVVMRRHWR